MSPGTNDCADIDLTDSWRVKRGSAYCHEGERFYPTNKPNPTPGRVYGLVEGCNIEQDMPLDWLEPFYEPPRYIMYVQADEGGGVFMATGFNTYVKPGAARVIVWRDEEGKTHVKPDGGLE